MRLAPAPPARARNVYVAFVGGFNTSVWFQNQATRAFAEIQREVIQRYHDGELNQSAAQLQIERFWAGALRRAVIDGDIESGSLMAGQSVGMVTGEQSAADILTELVEQATAAAVARG